MAAQGFEGVDQHGVLEVGNALQVDAQMTIGNSSAHVEVEASSALSETETANFKQVIDQQHITELPLNGRQMTQLILVSGGAVKAPGNDMVSSSASGQATGTEPARICQAAARITF